MSGATEREVSVSREIAATPETLWAMVSDVTRMGEWSPETTSCAWRKGATGPVVGARFAGTNRNGRRRWSTNCTVSAAEPGRRFAFRVDAGPVGIAEWAYTFEPSATGTVVTETWTDRRGRFGIWVGKPVSGVADRAAHNRAGMEETLARLAAVAEGAAR